MILNISRRKPKGQGLVYSLILLFLFTATLPFWGPLSTAYAIADPLSVPNNKFGIHIIQATPDESSPAASLVNTNGDWGYITVLIERRDRQVDKWQEFFNDLRRRHLIPLVRLATEPEGDVWKRPDLEDAKRWAEFLDSLNWPVKNRYVIIYNEPNHGQEWGGSINAQSYAQILDRTIAELKNKSEDFFVLNAGFDASAPSQTPRYQDQLFFMKQMNEEVPGIFDKLDGWVSHSYPNPSFAGSPDATGRGSVRTWFWEIQQLRNLGVTKTLPVFIAETGWKHSSGLNYNPNFPSPETIASYYIKAFNSAWENLRIVAVTPFLLSYQTPPFDHFSFKKIDSPEYHPHYLALQNLPKTAGKPVQENKGELVKGEVYSSLVAGEIYTISLTFKNTGQSIWEDSEVSLIPLQGGPELGIERIKIPKGIKVEPNQEYTFNISLKAPQKGIFKVILNLFSRSTQFESKTIEFTTEVKLPVILQVLNSLKWKDNPGGEYILRVSGVIGESSQKINMGADGKSKELEARQLLPDYEFDFTLEKPYYHPKTIHQKVNTGVNVLDFGTLEPKLFSAIFKPKELWKLLPFSN